MSPSNTFRSFTISLGIVILITESPINGFTLRRTKDTTTETAPETDLAIEESVLLEVKTLRTPNNIKAIDSKNEGGGKETVKHKLNSSENVSVDLLDEEIQMTSHEKSAKNKSGVLSGPKEYEDTVNVNITQGSIAFKDKKYNNNVNVTDNVTTMSLSEVTKSKERETTVIWDEKPIEKSSETTPEAQVVTASLYVSDSSISDKVDTEHYYNTDFTQPNDLPIKESTAHANKDILYPQKDSLRVKSSVNYNMTPEASETILFKASNNIHDTHNYTSSTINSISTIAEIETSLKGNNLTTSEDANIGTDATTVNPTTEYQNSAEKSFGQLKIPYVDPSWKKYTIIDRKRGSVKTDDLTTEKEDGMMKSETSQTRISLDKLFTYTPIPSLDKLREDLLSIANQSVTKKQEATYINEQSIHKMLMNANVNQMNSTSTLMPTESGPTKKIDAVSTKRAGFLDNSGRIAALDVTTSENVNSSKMHGTIYENKALYNDGQQSKNASGMESLSQLAEDAIKEELLKEMTLNDHEESKEKRYRAERTDIKTPTETTKNVLLSVQPITQDKSKNTSLYTVSPNYKQMKKIDVQPPKQFVRDPDDNRWRNESISSLGIVFKPKNSSKSFTQVLKNKTETEFPNLLDKDSKSGIPDLRERLEKIAEVRKSKKKRIDKFGEVVYTDYEESNTSSEVTSTSKIETTSATITFSEIISPTSTTSPTPSSIEPEITTKSVTSTEGVKLNKENTTTTKMIAPDTLTTQKPKKLYNIAEYYDTTDEYDADYLHLSKIDLQRFATPSHTTATSVAPLIEKLQSKPMWNYPSDRKPTIQYFPPRKPAKTRVNVNEYDDQFQRKVNLYTFQDIPNNTITSIAGTALIEPVTSDKPAEQNRQAITPGIMYKPDHSNKYLYLTHASRVTEPNNEFALNGGNYNRASYVIKHYRDFIDQAAKDDDDRNLEYTNSPFTESPMRGVTVNELAKVAPPKDKYSPDDSYDYDQQFRKDILNRFVDNFNQNSQRFKVDFPILYNSSVVHGKLEANGKVLASSSAFIKRLYDSAATKPNFFLNKKHCDPNCDNITVELSPAYELHYYVPDQEEKEEALPTDGPIPYRYSS